MPHAGLYVERLVPGRLSESLGRCGRCGRCSKSREWVCKQYPVPDSFFLLSASWTWGDERLCSFIFYCDGWLYRSPDAKKSANCGWKPLSLWTKTYLSSLSYFLQVFLTKVENLTKAALCLPTVKFIFWKLNPQDLRMCHAFKELIWNEVMRVGPNLTWIPSGREVWTLAKHRTQCWGSCL